ncbi:MAG TPA: hypothetical protein VNI20_08000 [Fimbriimonadaceae bacterium]|nr:hypothetical protein [Fimbriimonadaceae bacterium]
MKNLGLVLVIAGLLIAAFYMWAYRTYDIAQRNTLLVRAGTHLTNDNKVQNRQNGLIFGLGVGVIGSLLYGFASQRRD